MSNNNLNMSSKIPRLAMYKSKTLPPTKPVPRKGSVQESVKKHYNITSVVNNRGLYDCTCKYCDEKFRGNTRVSSNLKRHLSRAHADAINNRSGTNKMIKKYEANNHHQVTITRNLLDYLVQDMRPMSTLDSPHFKRLLESLNPRYQLPSRKHATTALLDEQFSITYERVTNQLLNVCTLSVTVDLWSNRQMKAYIGITGHYVSDNWQSKSVMLACKRVTGSHTSENIFKHYDDIMKDFKITGKISTIITGIVCI